MTTNSNKIIIFIMIIIKYTADYAYSVYCITDTALYRIAYRLFTLLT